MGKKRIVFSSIAAVVGFSAFVAAMVFYMGASADFDMAHGKNAAEITDLTNTLTAKSNRMAEYEQTNYNDVVNSAAEAGRTIADAQNTYLVEAAYEHGGADDPSVIMSDLLSNSMWNHGWTNAGPTLDGKECKWEFDTIYYFRLDVIPVLWTCWAGDDLLCAVTGDYVVSDGKFSNLAFYHMRKSEQSADQNMTEPVPEPSWVTDGTGEALR